jgi:membrane protease YdiL (CAAX protease family)
VGLLIAFGAPELRLWRRIAPGQDISLAREAVWWAIGAVMVGYVLLVERRPLSSIGLRFPNGKTFLFGVLTAVLLIVTFALSYAVIFRLLGLPANRAAVGQITRNPVWFLILLLTRAAVVEEIAYRGYAIERIEELTGSRSLAALISVVVFTLAHFAFWGGTHLIVVGFSAVILALLYLWRRDLICNMIAHLLTDLVGFLLEGAFQR